jgi:xylulokinase
MAGNKSLILGIDLGTSSVKAVLLDTGGAVLGIGQREYNIDVPSIGFAEQSPEEWWLSTIEAVRACVSDAGKNSGAVSVGAISFSGQMHGLVALGEGDKLVYPAVIWPDQRSAKQVETINEVQRRIGFDRSCNKASPGFMLSTLLWLKENDPKTLASIKRVMLPKDYICFRMTGVNGPEPTAASGSLAFDNKNGKWNDVLLNALSLPLDIFRR